MGSACPEKLSALADRVVTVCNVVIGYLVQEVITLVIEFLMCFGYQNANVLLSLNRDFDAAL